MEFIYKLSLTNLDTSLEEQLNVDDFIELWNLK